MTARVHVIGAGLSGLAAAVHLAALGRAVTVYEAANHAGGRCRSYFDRALGCRIDNGNHLLFSGNHAAQAYLRAIGAEDSLEGPATPRFPFIDLETGERWTLAPNAGRVPWWVWQADRRVAGTRAGDYLQGLRLAFAGRDGTVGGTLPTGHPLFRRMWEPLAVATLNTEAETAAASLLWRILLESFGQGGKACRPLVVREGLSESFVDPALAFLDRRGGAVRFGSRLRALMFEGDRLAALDFEEGPVTLGPADAAVLAVPASVAAALVPGLTAPDDFRAIVNGHFLFDLPARKGEIMGLVGGTVEWIFVRPRVISTTISAADRLADRSAEELAAAFWAEICRALELGDAPLPPSRIVKERRATFAATPAQLRRRPGARTRWRNLLLAGDYTATGLPATIEGAIRSGQAAARQLLNAGLGPRVLHAGLGPRVLQ